MKNKVNQLFYLLLLTLAFASVTVAVAVIQKSGLSGVDLLYYWKNSAYSVRGYSLEWVKSTGFKLENIGNNANGGIGVLPYGRLLLQVILPGYLPFEAARVYHWVVLMVVIGLLVWNITKWLKEQIGITFPFLCAILVCCFPWVWGGYLRAGNIGGVLALIAVLMSFYVEKHENMVAFLLALTLIKPQIGGIFVIVLFFDKRYKMLLKAFGVIFLSDIVYRIYVAIMCKVRNLTLEHENEIMGIISGYAGNQMDEERGTTWFLQYGLFNPLRDYGVSNMIVLMLSMISGVLFSYVCMRRLRSHNIVYTYSIAELASLFWFYKSECDSLVLIGCNLLVFIYWKYAKHNFSDLLWVAGYLVGINCLIGRYVFRFIFPVVTYNQGIFIDQLLQIVLFVGMILKIQKRNS